MTGGTFAIYLQFFQFPFSHSLIGFSLKSLHQHLITDTQAVYEQLPSGTIPPFTLNSQEVSLDD